MRASAIVKIGACCRGRSRVAGAYAGELPAARPEELAARGATGGTGHLLEEESTRTGGRCFADGILCLIDPIVAGAIVPSLMALILRDGARRVSLSAHIRTDLRMGTKEVLLVRTGDMGVGKFIGAPLRND